jgi:hypothetical protein
MRRLVLLCALLTFPALAIAQSNTEFVIGGVPINHPGALEDDPATFTLDTDPDQYFFITIQQEPNFQQQIDVRMQFFANDPLYLIRRFEWPAPITPPQPDVRYFGPLHSGAGGTLRVEAFAYEQSNPFTIAAIPVPQRIVPSAIGESVTLPVDSGTFTFITIPAQLNDRFDVVMTGEQETDLRIFHPLWGTTGQDLDVTIGRSAEARAYWVRADSMVFVAVINAGTAAGEVTVNIADNPIPRVTENGVRVLVEQTLRPQTLFRLDYEPGLQSVYFEVQTLDGVPARLRVQTYVDGFSAVTLASLEAYNLQYIFLPSEAGTLIIELVGLSREPTEYIIEGGLALF